MSPACIWNANVACRAASGVAALRENSCSSCHQKSLSRTFPRRTMSSAHNTSLNEGDGDSLGETLSPNRTSQRNK